MGFTEDIGIGGLAALTAIEAATGEVLDQRRAKNIVTLEGRKALGRCLSGGPAPSGALWMAVGTGTSTPALTDTALQAEDEALRVRATVSAPEVKVKDGLQRVIATVSATFAAPTDGASQTLTEGGIWVELGDGQLVLFNRVRFEPGIARSAGVDLQLAWEILF